MAKRRSDLDRLLDDVAERARERRISWARGVEGLTDRERAALTRAIKGAFGPGVSTADLRVGLAAMDRLGIGDL